MNVLKSVFNFYINSSIHIALSVCSLVYLTKLEFNIDVSNMLYGFIFFGTITGYNFVKYAEVARLRHRSLNLSLRTIQVFSFFCFLALIYFTLHIAFNTLVVTGGFAALTFFYAIPFLNNKSLRALIGVKIVIVAVVWAGVTVLIPLLDETKLLVNDNWISFIQRVLFVIVLTLPFEIRDLKYDELALGTLPQKVGVRTTKIIGIVLLLLVVNVSIFKTEKALAYSICFGIMLLVLVIFLLISRKKQTKYFSSFWVESVPIIGAGLYLMYANLF